MLPKGWKDRIFTESTAVAPTTNTSGNSYSGSGLKSGWKDRLFVEPTAVDMADFHKAEAKIDKQPNPKIPIVSTNTNVTIPELIRFGIALKSGAKDGVGAKGSVPANGFIENATNTAGEATGYVGNKILGMLGVLSTPTVGINKLMDAGVAQEKAYDQLKAKNPVLVAQLEEKMHPKPKNAFDQLFYVGVPTKMEVGEKILADPNLVKLIAPETVQKGSVKNALLGTAGAVKDMATQGFFANEDTNKAFDPNRVMGRALGGSEQGIANFEQKHPIASLVTSIAGGATLDAPMGALIGKGKQYLSNFVKDGNLMKIDIPVQTAESIAKETPTQQLLGKLKVKNTAFENAINNYNSAIEQIQNHFGTNQLRVDEMSKIKSELGIDFEKLVADIQKAETKGTNIKSLAERRRYSNVVGLTDRPTNLTFQKPAFPETPNIPNATDIGVPNTTVLPNATSMASNINIPKTSAIPNIPTMPNSVNPILTPGQKPRQFIENSVLNAPIIPDEMKQGFKQNMPTYEPVSNKGTWDKAVKKVDTNLVQAKSEWDMMSNLKNADDTALGEAILVNHIKNGNIPEANKTSVKLAEMLTASGQASQAAAILKRSTPEGTLMFAQRTVKNINKEIEKNLGKAAKKVELTNEDSKFILDTMNNVQGLADGREKDVAMAKIGQLLADKTPVNLRDKVRTLRNISLLGNPKTFIRNVGGNALMGTADNISNTVGATLLRPLDNYMAKMTGFKTVAMPSLKTQAKGFAEGGKTAISDSLGGLSINDLKGKSVKEQANLILHGASNPINTGLVSNDKFEIGKSLAFKNKPMRILENAVNTSLAIGDKPFSQAYYDDIINQLKKANKTDVITNEMKQLAEKVAQERTYQDVNTISSLATGLKNLPQKIQNHPWMQQTIQTFVDSLLPYVKTPASILKRGIEYTPAGVLEGILKLGAGIKNKNLTMEMQREIIDRISRGIVGTGILGAGEFLKSKGIITGAANKDPDVAALDKSQGKTPYSIKIGDKYYTYDWAAPMSMPLGAGAQLISAKKAGNDISSSVVDATANALNYYADQPMLQAIQRFLGSANNGKGIGERALGSALELPKQMVPTLLKQITQFTDKNQRETYSPNYFEQNLINPIKAKIPGISKTLPSKVDTLGNDVQNFQGKNNVSNIMLNPGTVSQYKTDPVTEMILNIYNKTKETGQFPRVAKKSIPVNGKTIQLTAEQYTAYQKFIGKETAKRFTELAKDKEFRGFDPDVQAKRLQQVLSDINKEAKQKLFPES